MANLWEEDVGHERVVQETRVQTNLQLLKDIHTTLVYAFNNGAMDGCKVYIRSKLAEIKLRIQPIPVPCDLSALSQIKLEKLSHYLEAFLGHCDDLVHEDILLHELLPQRHDPEQKQISHSKLKTLRDLISIRWRPDSVETKDALSDQTIVKFIMIQQGFENERRMVEKMALFLTVAGDIQSQSSNTRNNPQDSKDPSQVDSTALGQAAFAQKFCQQLVRLLESLSHNLRSCCSQHFAGIQFSKLGRGEEMLEILLSGCIERNDEAVLYPIECCPHRAPIATAEKPFQLCKHVERFRKRRRPVRLHYDQRTISAASTAGRDRLDKSDFGPSHQILSDMLYGQKDLFATLSRRSFTRASRKRLQCLLAQSLLYLYQVPTFDEIWDYEHIRFSRLNSIYDDSRPYACCILKNTPTVSHLEVEPDLETLDPSIFMARFGLLLLGIECQQHLHLTEDELSDEYGVEIALDRHIKQHKDDIDDSVLKVLKLCLDFDAFAEEFHHPSVTEDILKHRLIILNDIIKPLRQALAFSFPNIAAELPPIQHSDWPNEVNDTLPSSPKDESSEVLTTSLPIHGVLTHNTYSDDQQVPWKHLRPLGGGPYSFVDLVQATGGHSHDSNSSGLYVRKRVKPSKQGMLTLHSIEREVALLRSVQHPHIVTVRETYTLKSEFSLILSPVADSDLATYLTQNPRPGSASPMRSWFGCLAATLSFLHQRKIKHRDIKPGNILVKGTEILVSDFGISKNMWDEMGTGTVGPIDGRSPMYCAPEVMTDQDEQHRGRPADVFSLGCVFLEMVTTLLADTGCSLTQLHASIKVDGRKSYSASLDHVLVWIFTLYTSIQTHHDRSLQSCVPVLEWCLAMFFPHRNDRIGAEALKSAISAKRSGVFTDDYGTWMRPCCQPDVAGGKLDKPPLLVSWPDLSLDDIEKGRTPDWRDMKGRTSFAIESTDASTRES